MHRYYVYILRCADQSYYVGVSNDFQRRLAEHKEGLDRSSFTFNRRPIELVFQVEFQDVNQAIAFEKQVKGWSRAKKEALIRGDWEELPELSRSKNPNASMLRQAQHDKPSTASMLRQAQHDTNPPNK